jgi:hypothetical protein
MPVCGFVPAALHYPGQGRYQPPGYRYGWAGVLSPAVMQWQVAITVGLHRLPDLVLDDEHRPDFAHFRAHNRRKIGVNKFSSVYPPGNLPSMILEDAPPFLCVLSIVSHLALSLKWQQGR